MDPLEYERMYHVEDEHWWYRGMEAITRSILSHYVRRQNQNRIEILDAGCGTGAAMASYLANFGPVTGLDFSPIALRFCVERGLVNLAQASVTEIPFRSEAFDLVTSFDVLYERGVTNDSNALNEFNRVLRPNGFLLLRLPAYDWLRGHHDVTIHTARRYTAAQAAKLLGNSGFQVVHITYANTILFPLAVLKRLSEKLWPPEPESSDLSIKFGAFNKFLKLILSCEAPFATRVNIPFGLSVIVLGQKNKN